MTARRIGWKWPRYDMFIDRHGRQLDLKEVCPQDIKAMVCLDSDAAMWASWTQQEQWTVFSPRPCIDPLVRFCASARRPLQSRMAAERLVTRGAKTQSVLHQWGHVDDAACRVCGQDGTPHHRFWHCVGHSKLRGCCNRTHQHVGAESRPSDLLFTRGLAREHGVPFLEVQESVRWQTSELDGAGLRGNVCTDGSLKHKHRSGGQCGWAAVSGHGSTPAVTWGCMPAKLPVHKRILRAELWAVLQALRHAVPPIAIHTDCAAVLLGVSRGRRLCCAARSKHADVWRLIWGKFSTLVSARLGLSSSNETQGAYV